MHNGIGPSAREAADRLGLVESTRNCWKGQCPFCEKHQFWITGFRDATGWNCTGCQKEGTDFSELPGARRHQRLLLTVDELLNRPPRSDLIKGVLPESSLALLCGRPESKKTFVALDWALGIAAGRTWQGREVKAGPVVYVAAEGQDQLAKRIAAWMSQWGVTDLSRFRIVEVAVNLLDRQDVDDLIAETVQELGPAALVVFDTLHRSMGGGDENSAKDIGLVLSHIDLIRAELGCAALLLHHPGHNSRRPRGSSALPGALDTSMYLKRSGETLRLSCEKSKDALKFEPIDLRTVEHEGSLVVLPSSNNGQPPAGSLETLHSLAQHAVGLTAVEWLEASGLAQSTFYGHRGELEDQGLVEKDKEGRGARYKLTEKGHEALAPFANKLPESSDSSTSSHAPPFRGAGGGSLGASQEVASEEEGRWKAVASHRPYCGPASGGDTRIAPPESPEAGGNPTGLDDSLLDVLVR